LAGPADDIGDRGEHPDHRKERDSDAKRRGRRETRRDNSSGPDPRGYRSGRGRRRRRA
jgi:hypothetical protein